MPVSAVLTRRLACAAVLAGVVGLGILSRTVPLGWFWYDKSFGDLLYATAAYFALALLLPRAAGLLLAAAAAVICLAVEFLQLTQFNVQLLRVPVVRWFLGTTFSWHDVLCYFLGVAAAITLDRFCLRHPFWSAPSAPRQTQETG